MKWEPGSVLPTDRMRSSRHSLKLSLSVRTFLLLLSVPNAVSSLPFCHMNFVLLLVLHISLNLLVKNPPEKVSL